MEISSLAKLGTMCRLWLAALVLMATAGSLLAGDSAGVLLAFSGQVEIRRGAETLPATKRAELRSGDTLVTADGQVQVRFNDGTLLTLYRDTRFAVDDYRYTKGKDERAHFSLLEGLMHTLTGQMDKQNYLLKTRLANLGVRGTEYSARLADTLHVSVDQGSVVIANAGGTLQVGAGGNAIVQAQNAMPQSTSAKIDVRAGGAGRAGPGGPPPPGGNATGAAPGGPPPPPPPPGTQNMNLRTQTPVPTNAPPAGPPGGPPPGPPGPGH